jgi:carboxypeptidase family protein
MKIGLILYLLLLSAAIAHSTHGQQTQSLQSSDGQKPGPKTRGAITGRVISTDGQPVTNAFISATPLAGRGIPGQSAVSDEGGNFKLTGLSPGAYLLSASMPGYVSADLPLENSIHRLGENVIISLIKGGVITGRVSDNTGEPLVGVTVSQRCLRTLEGKKIVPGYQMDRYGFGRTDDRGIYRIYGLPPGEYIVGIDGNDQNSYDAQIWRDSPTYHPSAARDSAVKILLHSGEEVSGIDIRHRGERGHTVSGYFPDATASSYSNITVILGGFDGGRIDVSSFGSSSRGFAIFGVPDGEHELTAIGEEEGNIALARRRISVKGADVSGIELKLAPCGSIAGRVVIESSNPPKRCANNDRLAQNRSSVVEEIVLRPDRDDPDRPMLPPQYFSYEMFGRTPNASGEFTLKNLESGRYRIAVDLPDDGWQIERSINPPRSKTPNRIAPSI